MIGLESSAVSTR